ncbi:hypothetical protein JCM10296v2_003493 [Rhodotorula toruloides]
MLSWSDGDWVEDYGWTRWGLKPTSTPALEGEEGEGHVTDGDEDAELQYAPATAMGDAVASMTPSSTLPVSHAASASPSPTTTSTPSPSPTLPFRARYSAKIPPGWTPQERETNYYAVPIIIAMSVLVAVIVVASIVVSVVVRRRKKRRREKRRERRRARKEGAGGGKGEQVEGEKLPQTKEREKGWRGVVGRVEDGLRMRNKGKKKAQQAVGEREGEAAEEVSPAPARRRIVRTTGFAAGDRVRPRRRRRRADGGEDDEDDEGTALTRTGTSSTTSSIVNDTLTARVAARLRRQDSAGSAARRIGGAGTTTVFSRDVNAQSAVSLTASALSRVSSRASGSSRRLPASSASSGAGGEQPTILFTPADDTTLPAHLPLPGSSVPPSPSLTPTPSSSRALQPQPPIPTSPSTPTAAVAAGTDPSTSAFYRSLIVSDDSLPAPGPPAYRPSGSTVQATRRFGAGDAGASGGRHGRVRRVFGRREREREGAREEDEGEWYWPGEKGRTPFVAGESTSSATAPALAPESAPASTVPDEDDPPVDRSLFTAHVATDDKAVLARLRAQRDVILVDEEAGAVAGPSSALPAPSAPAPEEEDDAEVDADGFERYDLAEVGASPFDGASTRVASSSSTLLPAPPPRVHQPSLGARSGSTVPLLSSASTASTPLASPFLSTEKAALADSYAAAAEEREEDALPLYLAGSGQSGAREALAMASAPPRSEDGDEDEEEEGWAREGMRNEGEREVEGIV